VVEGGREEMAADFLDPVYESWLSEEIAAGRISCPGWSDYRLRAAWLCCEWAGSPMPNIDPQKSAEADRAYVELGAQTLDDVARNFNGSSGKANRAKNARMFEEWPTPPWNQAPVQTTPDESEEDDDEKKPPVNRGQMVSIQTPVGDVEFQMKKRSVKKIAHYKDMYGQPKTMQITEEEL
jgi:capsid protein